MDWSTWPKALHPPGPEQGCAVGQLCPMDSVTPLLAQGSCGPGGPAGMGTPSHSHSPALEPDTDPATTRTAPFWKVCTWPHSPRVKGLGVSCSSACFDPALLVMLWQRTLCSDLLIEI